MSFTYADGSMLSSIFLGLLFVAIIAFIGGAGAVSEDSFAVRGFGVFVIVIAVASTVLSLVGASQASDYRQGFVEELEKTYSIELTNESRRSLYGEELRTETSIPVIFIHDDEAFEANIFILRTDDTFRVTVRGAKEELTPLDEALTSGEGISAARSLGEKTEQEEKR